MAQTTNVREDQLNLTQLWLFFVSGPIIWSVHFTLIYIFAEFGCATKLSTFIIAEFDGVVIAIFITTIVALILGVWGAFASYQLRSPDNINDDDVSYEFKHFMAESGWIMNAIFSIVIIATAVHAIWLSSCSHFGIWTG